MISPGLRTTYAFKVWSTQTVSFGIQTNSIPDGAGTGSQAKQSGKREGALRAMEL